MNKRQYVTKLHRQHSSMVTSVPVMIRIHLELTNNDHLVWEVDDNSDFVQISKVVPMGKNHAKNTGSEYQGDKGRRT